MVRIAYILLFMSISLIAYGQTIPDGNDTIPDAVKNYDVIFNDLVKNKPVSNLQKYNLGINSKQNIGYKSKAESLYPEFESIVKLPKIKVYQGPPVYHGVTVDSNLGINQSITGSFGFMYDYSYRSALYKLADNLYITLGSSHNTYIGIGSIRMINPKLTYQPTNWLFISGGVYGTKDNIYGMSFYDLGYNGALKFILSEKVRINVYGQYSTRSNANMKDYSKSISPVNVGTPMMYMMPQTSFGASIEYKVNKNFGIEGGVMRELNPFNGKWKNTPFIAPVFYRK